MFTQEQVVCGDVWRETSAENLGAISHTFTLRPLDVKPVCFSTKPLLANTKKTKISYDLAVTRFITDCENRLRPITVREYRRHLAFFKFKKDLSNLERSDIFNKLDELKSTPTNQNYAFTAMKVFLNWCVRNQYIPHNPIAVDKKPARLKSRERVLNDGELAALYSYVRANRSLFHDMVALLILTGQRRTEISHMCWDEIDEGCLVLLGDRTKKPSFTHTTPAPNSPPHTRDAQKHRPPCLLRQRS